MKRSPAEELCADFAAGHWPVLFAVAAPTRAPRTRRPKAWVGGGSGPDKPLWDHRNDHHYGEGDDNYRYREDEQASGAASAAGGLLLGRVSDIRFGFRRLRSFAFQFGLLLRRDDLALV